MEISPPEAHSVATGRGWGWIVDGFGLFRGNWMVWILVFLLSLVIYVAFGLLPVLGTIATALVGPILTGGLMHGCREIDRGQPLEVGHLFGGFRDRAGSLAAVGAILLLGELLVIAVVVATAFGLAGAGVIDELLEANAQQAPPLDALIRGVLLPVLIGLLLVLPLLMAYWFAPALVMLHGVSALQAMRLSFSGCLNNLLPFLVYGLAALGLCIVATIPMMLGFLVLGPVLIGSMYAGYKDIFVN